MDETQTESEVPEVATPEVENHASQDQQKVSEETSQKEDAQDRNWRAVREKQRELERELRMQREMNERLLQMTQPAPRQEIDELDSISDEEFIPKGKQKKLVRKEVEPLQREIDELKKQLNHQKDAQFLDRLKVKYSDFNDIVNAETLALLEDQNPELAATIAELKDPYKIGIQSYNYIKAMNLSSQVPQKRRLKEVEKKIAQNEKTVQTPQAFDKRPMAQAFRMTDADKKNLYKEMMEYAGQAGFSY